MNFVRSPATDAHSDDAMRKNLSSIRSKVRKRSLILAKRRAIRAAAELDPKLDLQAQIRPSLHVQIKDLLRPGLRERPSSPGLDCFGLAESPQTKHYTQSEPTPEQQQKTALMESTGRKSVVVRVNPDRLNDHTLCTTPYSHLETDRDELSPTFDRLASPENFTGVYRRRSAGPFTGQEAYGHISHHTDLSASRQHNIGRTYDGSNNLGTDEKISDIAQVMRPWLRTRRDQRTPTTLAISDHEVKRRATLLNLKEYKDVYQQSLEVSDPNQSSDLSLRSSAAFRGIKHKPISAARKDSCFERLSDPSLFVGIHKHRFDPVTGKGQGKLGRDFPAKGLGHIPGGQRVPILSRPQKKITKTKSFYNPAPKHPNRIKDAARKEVERQQQRQETEPDSYENCQRPHPLGDSFWEFSDPNIDWDARKLTFEDYHTIRLHREKNEQ